MELSLYDMNFLYSSMFSTRSNKTRLRQDQACHCELTKDEINEVHGCNMHTTTLFFQVSQDSLCPGHKQVHGRAMNVYMNIR
jgi:hypothetical protein